MYLHGHFYESDKDTDWHGVHVLGDLPVDKRSGVSGLQTLRAASRVGSGYTGSERTGCKGVSAAGGQLLPTAGAIPLPS